MCFPHKNTLFAQNSQENFTKTFRKFTFFIENDPNPEFKKSCRYQGGPHRFFVRVAFLVLSFKQYFRQKINILFDYHSIILKDFVIARHRQNKPGAGCWENARQAANRISKKENRN